MPLTSYKPYLIEVRQTVIACAEDQNSLVLKPRTWQRISASASVHYKSVLSELTIKKEGWPKSQNRNTCKIRPDSGLPQNVHDVRCTLLQQVKRGSDGPMWKVSIFDEGVEGRELEIHPDHLFKILE